VLNGIVRARVLARAAALGVRTVVVAARVEALEGARAAFLTNSLIGVRPVRRFEGRSYAPHELITRLAAGL
jgi:branched-chain amino acid aminotransferase/4-amino-4-deoxychorismate lyase